MRRNDYLRIAKDAHLLSDRESAELDGLEAACLERNGNLLFVGDSPMLGVRPRDVHSPISSTLPRDRLDNRAQQVDRGGVGHLRRKQIRLDLIGKPNTALRGFQNYRPIGEIYVRRIELQSVDQGFEDCLMKPSGHAAKYQNS